MKNYAKKLMATAMAAVMLLPFTSCRRGNEPEMMPADYGSYGADFARELASDYPYRAPYSTQESAAAQRILEEFETLGYEAHQQDFTNSSGVPSSNIIARYSGKGFYAQGDDGSWSPVRKTVIIGAHYDSVFDRFSVPDDCQYDGISDNASGVGCLMTIAAHLTEYENMGFDVILVAFGAGNDNYNGARYFYNSLSAEERESIEVMYCIDSIYAGDKIYANAGYNSLDYSQKYKMRRKLYQAYDVAYDYMLSSLYGYNLLYNESNIIADVNGDGINDVYREVSARKSDYLVFDEAGIPVVYFDSCDYFFDTMEEMKETKNLNLQEYGGAIRGTYLDASSILDPILNTEEGDRLEIRINNTAFVILESMMKGSDYGVTYEEYQDILRHPETETTAPEAVASAV
ncbi:MAG: M28 family peptidase [Clostridiales bacterium]|nr:M28 family peptidase [Clostridiales bacterium]